MSKHTELIDAVNDAKTEYEHTYAEGVLAGWREGLEYCGRRWDFIEADEHSAERFGDRPICCGVLLDWEPASDALAGTAASIDRTQKLINELRALNS